MTYHFSHQSYVNTSLRLHYLQPYSHFLFCVPGVVPQSCSGICLRCSISVSYLMWLMWVTDVQLLTSHMHIPFILRKKSSGGFRTEWIYLGVLVRIHISTVDCGPEGGMFGVCYLAIIRKHSRHAGE